MNSQLIIGACILSVAFLAGCNTLQGVGEKQAGGALMGAGVGGYVGSQFGSGTGQLATTAAGTLIGGMLGSEVGSSLDNADRAVRSRPYYYGGY